MVKCLVSVFVLCASLAGAQSSNSPPNLEGWKLVQAGELDLETKIQAGGLVYTAHVGFTEDYQNPEVLGEFVRIIKRHIPVIPIIEDDQQKPNFQSEIISNYSRKSSYDALIKIRSQADAVGYTRWHIVKDSRTGEDIQTGEAESWLRISNGDWVYANGAISRELYSEVSPYSGEVALMGVKLSLGNKYHILKADPADLVQKKGDKK